MGVDGSGCVCMGGSVDESGLIGQHVCTCYLLPQNVFIDVPI